MASVNSSTSSADADGSSPAAAPPPASDSASPPPNATPNWTLFLQAYMQKLAQLHEMESLAKQLLHHQQQQQQQLAATSPTRPPPDLKPPESIAVPSPLSPVEQLIAVNRIASLVPDAQCASAATQLQQQLLANTSLLAMLQSLQTMQETPQSPSRGLDSLLRMRAPRAASGAELKPFVSGSPFAGAQADAGSPLLGGLLAALACAPAANSRANQPPPQQPQQEQILAGLRATIERGGGGAELVGLLALLLVRLLEANANASAPQAPAAAPDAAAAQQLCQALLACKQESGDVHAGVGLDVKHNVGPARPVLDEVDRGPVFPPFGPRFSPPAAAPSIECVSCSRTFSSPQALGNHMKRCELLLHFHFHLLLVSLEKCNCMSAGHTVAPRRAR